MSEDHERATWFIRNDEKLAILFLAMAVSVSCLYGYPFRFYLLVDLILKYALVFPVFLVFLFYSSIENPHLRFGWTALASAAVLFLLAALAYQDFPGILDHINFKLATLMVILLWCGPLVVYLFKRPKEKGPPFSTAGLRTQALNLLTFIRDWTPLFIVMFSYCTLKSIIPVVNPRLFDEQLHAVDCFLFLGHSPTDLIVEWMPVSMMGFLSLGYKFYFFLKITAFSAIYCMAGNKRPFYKMTIAFSTTYMLGLILYFLFPAQGPIYHYPEEFDKIRKPMVETSNYQLQKDLWSVYEQVKKHSPQEFCELTKESGIRNGVAAFPSLHIAISCVLLYFLFRYVRPVFWICLFPFFLMGLSTIYFGWHYVIDDVAGLFLASLVLAFMKFKGNEGV